MLTADMKRAVREQRLGFVATVNPDGTPNVSPKATFIVVDDATLAFAEIRSPGTLRNLRANPAIEVNFVDPFVRKGYRFAGAATILERGGHGFEDLRGRFAEFGDLVSRMRTLVRISIARVAPITSPAYDRGKTEAELRRLWAARFRSLQPNERFEE
jgi:predicted pyridoxine 5'-phosphate oxidase superfamily flavin-nucleotide-binding protein